MDSENQSFRLKYLSILKTVIVVSAVIGLLSILLEYGLNLGEEYDIIWHMIAPIVVLIYILYFLSRFYFEKNKIYFLRSHAIESVITLFIFIEFILILIGGSIIQRISSEFKLNDITYIYIVLAQIYIVLGIGLSALRLNKNILESKIHPARLLLLSFLITILIGTGLLMLPAATVDSNITFIDALFTATSAVCVTGLIVQDTATYFTQFGHTIIMLLFQVGGLGLMTFTTFIAIFLSGGLGIKEKVILKEMIHEDNINAIQKVLSLLILVTFIIEGTGATIMYFSIREQFAEPMQAVYFSMFHAVSAFCNAGFSLNSAGLMEPVTHANHIFVFVISVLIILGGIGFPTIIGIKHYFSRKKGEMRIKIKLPLQIKIIFVTTVFLILFGTVGFYILEVDASLKGMAWYDKIFHSYFQSVTSRTAGFNTIDTALLRDPSALLVIFLMFIGGSPGGTGGGIRTTTFAIIVLSIVAALKNSDVVKTKNRSISDEIVKGAFLIFFVFVFFVVLGIFALSITEHHDLVDIAFEAFSASATVGLSKGITSDLSDPGKIIVTILMFIGRIGPVTLLFALSKQPEKVNSQYPNENISTL